ncbi:MULTISPECIES: hypothetical protein [unclassified Microcystis]|uniref:hypothetical protein n=1 Tax=unclassified Microcystis TaxID=2643300 RepID=UPI0022CC255D|nr:MULTISPECIES: hypothetical protein [unclassified Microcystis]MCA2504253.1 hypothetical protein [Microcystis sp. M62BS1]MCA2522881.1 hypothetical protein [Microcystis sp. M63BS1]MCA2551949.1 hypothetical protein [Microcystis sp. M53BS1]MCA2609542.1 hypothetical protein [Microcystis sp. M27BS1]MCA2516704.1 hypothetical protein [Microcystis sp. M59BS1]
MSYLEPPDLKEGVGWGKWGSGEVGKWGVGKETSFICGGENFFIRTATYLLSPACRPLSPIFSMVTDL